MSEPVNQPAQPVFRYFVSYVARTRMGMSYGCSERLVFGRPILHIEDVRAICDRIAAEGTEEGFEAVTILSFQLFPDCPERNREILSGQAAHAEIDRAINYHREHGGG